MSNLAASDVFSESDLLDIKSRGMAVEKVLEQIDMFKKGATSVKLKRPCTVGDGIVRLSDKKREELSATYRQAEAAGRPLKFVPASGAASRMFKLLQSFMNRSQPPSWEKLQQGAEQGNEEYARLRQFITQLPKFAFYNDLKAELQKENRSLEELRKQGDYEAILSALLEREGMNYANFPKGMIKFHHYPGENRTAFEEHLVEALAYAKDRRGLARVHFTIPNTPAERQSVIDHIESVRPKYEQDGVRLAVSYSEQKHSTDTIAVDMQNRPFRDEEGRLLFRPGGHGALLENLNDLQGDLIYIKNIDNVVPDRLKESTILWKTVLGGFLVQLQDRLFGYLEQLSTGEVDSGSLAEMFRFAEEVLSIYLPGNIRSAARDAQSAFLFERFHRPLRVCGMVKNEGEPGGGPFWVAHPDGHTSLQVVESAQVDQEDPQQREIFESSTHFSPVDFTCGVRDYRGEPFDLHDYRDPDSFFITKKYQNGRELQALELPGLWNGGMAYWNSVFVEVPNSTFNPVKTVFDLLREEHLA